MAKYAPAYRHRRVRRRPRRFTGNADPTSGARSKIFKKPIHATETSLTPTTPRHQHLGAEADARPAHFYRRWITANRGRHRDRFGSPRRLPPEGEERVRPAFSHADIPLRVITPRRWAAVHGERIADVPGKCRLAAESRLSRECRGVRAWPRERGLVEGAADADE